MAGTVSFPNMGSNIDVQSIINAYVSSESATQNQMQQHVQDLQAESTSISGISSALSTLSSSLSALSDSNTIQSYTATSSGSEIATSVVGTPQPGTYSVDVISTAQAYRAYSSTLSAEGGASPYKWSLARGSVIPAGLSLSKAGVLSGTPTKAGTYSFGVKVKASGNSASATLTLVVGAKK